MRMKNLHTKICMLTAQWRKDENKQQSLAITTQNPVKWQPATENISYLIQKPARG